MCVGLHALQDAESLEGVLVERHFSPRLILHVPPQSLDSVRVNRTVSRVHEVQVVTHQSAPVGHNEEADLGPALDSSYMPIAQSLRPYLSRPIREL